MKSSARLCNATYAHPEIFGSTLEGYKVANDEPTATWEIKDREGTLQALHIRFDRSDEKEVLWRLPNAKKWGLQGKKLRSLPLYGSESLKGWPDADPIVIAEGEKATDALLEAGFRALGTVTGASVTPGHEVLELLRGRKVVLWPDNDDAGRAHMECVASVLKGIASEVRIFEWDDAPKKGDAADHPAVASKSPDALTRLYTKLVSSPQWESKDPKTGDWPETFTAADLMALELSPIAWIVRDILPEGVTLLAGKPKLGKSWMALGLSIAVANGGVALGRERVEQGQVLYISLEENRRRLKKRLGILLNGDAPPIKLHMVLDWPRADQGGVEALDRWIERHPDTRLIIIDTLARFKPPHTGKRSQYDADRDAVDPLGPIAAERGVSILLVHHLREMESADPLDMITGSVGLIGGVDGALVLKRERGRADAFLHVEGRDIENPTELALRFDQNAATWTVVGDAEEYRISERRKAILEVLKNADEPLGPMEITERLNARGVDMKCGAVRETLSQMVKAGQVKKLGRGQYVHPDNLHNIPDIADTLTDGKG